MKKKDNKEQFDTSIDVLKYSAVDMMLDGNENQPEAQISDNLKD